MAVMREPPLAGRPAGRAGAPVPSVAGPATRVLARLVDFTAALAALLVTALATGSFGEATTGTGADWGLLACIGGLILGEATLLRWWGRTPGKAAFGLSVAAGGGGRLPWPRAAIRALLAWSPLLPVARNLVTPAEIAISLGLVAAVGGPALARRDHRGLHDLAVDSVVLRPVPSARGRLLRLGVDLAVLGAAAFAGAYGAYGFTTPSPLWYFGSPGSTPYGDATQVDFPPGVTQGYIFSTPVDPSRAPRCSVSAFGGSVPLEAAGPPPAFDPEAQPIGDPLAHMQAIYAFRGTPGSSYTVTCESSGTTGSYLAASVALGSRTVGNVIEAAGFSIVLVGVALIVVAVRKASAPGADRLRAP